MSVVHRYLGYAVPAGFAVLALWALVSFLRNRPPSDRFWTLLGILQVVIGVQVVIGGILFLLGLSPPSEPAWLHYAYGGLFPAALLVAAHRAARRFEDVPWLVFGAVAFVNFGLTTRALMTGLGS